MGGIPVFQSFANFNAMNDEFFSNCKSYLAFPTIKRFYLAFLVFDELKTIPFDILVTLSRILNNRLNNKCRFALFGLHCRQGLSLFFLFFGGISHAH